MKLVKRLRDAIASVAGRAGLAAGAGFHDSVRPTDSFLVTYPKSGTTWVSYFLSCAMADRNGGDSSSLDLASFRDWVPGVNDAYFGDEPLSQFADLPDPRVFTIHAPYDPLLERVVYLVRDPRDVTVSHYYHLRRTKRDFVLDMDAFIDDYEPWPCAWRDHVEGWLDVASEPGILLARYEDLQADPHRELASIAAHLRMPLSDVELDHYVEMASFENMRRKELPIEEQPNAVRQIRFMRKGEAGGWRDDLTRDQVGRIERRCGDLMERLGYRSAVEGPPSSSGTSSEKCS